MHCLSMAGIQVRPQQGQGVQPDVSMKARPEGGRGFTETGLTEGPPPKQSQPRVLSVLTTPGRAPKPSNKYGAGWTA